MNISEQWNSDDWDDEPLSSEELSETLAIHRRHKDDEDVCRRPRSKRISGSSIPSALRSIFIH